MLPLLDAGVGVALLVPTLTAMPAVQTVSHAPADDARSAVCAYSSSAPGWAALRHAPRGTSYVVFTMRTGGPDDWDTADVTSTSGDRQWQVQTGVGMSAITWVTFYSDEGWIDSHMVHIRCEGAPANWPA